MKLRGVSLREAGQNRRSAIYVRPTLHLGSHVIACSHVSLLCPMPIVSSSTAVIGSHTIWSYADGSLWRQVTGCSASSGHGPIWQRELCERVQGRSVETALSISVPADKVFDSRITSSTCMTKICAIVDGDTVYGMHRETLPIVAGALRTYVVRSLWTGPIVEDAKVTLRHVNGATVVLTYTGTTAYTGSPTKISATLGNFLNMLAQCFTGQTAEEALLTMRQVLKPQWSVAIADIPH